MRVDSVKCESPLPDGRVVAAFLHVERLQAEQLSSVEDINYKHISTSVRWSWSRNGHDR